MQDDHEPPGEYHRILEQFRTQRNWSSIHEPEPEQNVPSINLDVDDYMLENAMLEAASRRQFPGALDLVSPFRIPNIFDYQDPPTETRPARSDPNISDVISEFLSFHPLTDREDVERYFATEPTVQNRYFEQELRDICNENHDIVVRHDRLVQEYQLLTSHGYQNSSIVYRYCMIQVLAELREAATSQSEVFERCVKIRGILLCIQVLRGETNRVEANRQWNLCWDYHRTLHHYLAQVNHLHQGAERLDYFNPPGERELLTTLADVDTHMADHTFADPIAYVLTRQDFLEEVEERSSNFEEWDFQERLDNLRVREEEIGERYQSLFAEQQSLTQHGYHNTSVMYRHRYIWVCGEIWEPLHNKNEEWDKFTELQDLELRELLLRGEITIEQIQQIRDETRYRENTLSVKEMQAWIAYVEAKRLVGFNAVAQHEAAHANTNFLTSIITFLTRLHKMISGALGL